MSEKVWYLDINGEAKGPYTAEQIIKAVKKGKITDDTLAFGPGRGKWDPISWIPELTTFDKKNNVMPDMPKPTFHRNQLAHEIDFEIKGGEIQFVEIELDPSEAVMAEAGSMMFMHDTIKMETVFGSGDENKGIIGALMGAGKRLLTGESLFMTVFTNHGAGKERVGFSAPYPGKIIPLNLAELGGEIICQKDAFLCAAKGVSVDIAFQKKLRTGFFGGEGFIMQSLKGDGLAFIHAGGSILSRELKAGEVLKVDTGCVVAYDTSVDFDIEYVGSIKSAFFGGEGFFYASLRGPGTIWLQSMPFSRFATKVISSVPSQGGGKVGEGSVIDGITQIADIFSSR